MKNPQIKKTVIKGNKKNKRELRPCRPFLG